MVPPVGEAASGGVTVGAGATGGATEGAGVRPTGARSTACGCGGAIGDVAGPVPDVVGAPPATGTLVVVVGTVDVDVDEGPGGFGAASGASAVSHVRTRSSARAACGTAIAVTRRRHGEQRDGAAPRNGRQQPVREPDDTGADVGAAQDLGHHGEPQHHGAGERHAPGADLDGAAKCEVLVCHPWPPHPVGIFGDVERREIVQLPLSYVQ